MSCKKGFVSPSLLIIFFLILALVATLGYFLILSPNKHLLNLIPNQNGVSDTGNDLIYTPSPPTELQRSLLTPLKLNAGKIYYGETELFYNASEVKTASIGPDNHTVHFEVTPKSEWEVPTRCGDFIVPIDQFDKSLLPVDYQRIGSEQNFPIAVCKNYKEGVFLLNSSNLAYLEINQSKESFLKIENLITHKQLSIKIDEPLLTTLKKHLLTPPNNGVPADYEYSSMGTAYIFPKLDSPEVNNRFLLSLGKGIVEVNTTGSGKITDTYFSTSPDERIVDVTVTLLTNKNIPVAIRYFGWEGMSGYIEAMDYSSDKIKRTSLEAVNTYGFDFFNRQKLTWQEKSGFTIETYKESEIPSGEYKQYQDQINYENIDTVKIATIEENAANYLKQKLHNSYVICRLGPGLYSGCVSASGFTSYTYTVGSGKLQKAL